MSTGIQYILADLLQASFEYHKGTGRINTGGSDIVRIRVPDSPLDLRMKFVGGLIQHGVATAILTATTGIGLVAIVTKSTVAVGVVNRRTCSDDTALIFSVSEFVYDNHEEIQNLMLDAVAVYELKGRRKTGKWRLIRDKAVDKFAPEGNPEGSVPAVSGG